MAKDGMLVVFHETTEGAMLHHINPSPLYYKIIIAILKTAMWNMNV